MELLNTFKEKDPRLPSELTEQEWLIEGLLKQGSLAMMYGEVSSGKSFLALDLGACVATGKAWHGREVTQGKVIYMASEGRRGLKRRQMAWEQANDLRTGKQMLLSAHAIDLNNGEAIEKLRTDIRSIPESENIKLVIVDSLSGHNLGDESSVLSNLREIQEEFGATVLLVHFKSEPSIRQALDAEFWAERHKEEVTFSVTKQKDFDQFRTMYFHLKQIKLRDSQGQELIDNFGGSVTSCVLEESEWE